MKIFLAGILIIITASCYYDSQEFLYPKVNTTCDTTNVTYSKTVQPILSENCYSCHSNSNASLGGGYKLEDYPDVKIRVDDGKLWGSITQASGYFPMPPSGSLDGCSISKIKIWIDAKAPNN
jgi:cytochrome c5